MTFWFLVVRQISAGVMEGESDKCGGIQRRAGVRRPVEVEWERKVIGG